MISKRAQAALEFLTTYGWAFLVILIMIGTLAYFGVLSPGKFLPNRCNFGSEFQCLDYQLSVSAPNSLRMKLKNNIGEAITVQSITLGSEGSTALTCTASYPAVYPWADAMKSGNITDFYWTGCNYANAGFVIGEKGKVLVTIRYYSVLSGANYAKEAKGEILSAVI